MIETELIGLTFDVRHKTFTAKRQDKVNCNNFITTDNNKRRYEIGMEMREEIKYSPFVGVAQVGV